jgi:hypothetical protein
MKRGKKCSTSQQTMRCGYFDENYVEKLKGKQFSYAFYTSGLIFVNFRLQQTDVYIRLASYPNHSYHGQPSYQCRHCKALFWYGERIGASYGKRTVEYNKCCKGGKVYLPPYKPRPEPLASLARFDGSTTLR